MPDCVTLTLILSSDLRFDSVMLVWNIDRACFGKDEAGGRRSRTG